MPHRKYISSLDVAAESLRLGRVVVESDRNRTKRARATVLNPREGYISDPFYLVTYAACGAKFTVAVQARPDRLCPDGISVMHNGADDRGPLAHYHPMIADLPAAVRVIVRDVQAAMRFTEPTRASKARERRHAEDERLRHARIREKHPTWYHADGTPNDEARERDLDRWAKLEEKWESERATKVAS